MELRYAVVDNKVKKPGPVFTAITKEAYYNAKADYIYRVNDDTELATRWAKKFTHALATMDNVGAVGPACKQGNRRILTHDFTHRKHMDIFQGQYYPPDLSDWWMDDWISRVYGAARTIKASNVEIVHHTHQHGQRGCLMIPCKQDSVQERRAAIRKWAVSSRQEQRATPDENSGTREEAHHEPHARGRYPDR